MMNKPYLPWSRWLKTSGYGTDIEQKLKIFQQQMSGSVFLYSLSVGLGAFHYGVDFSTFKAGKIVLLQRTQSSLTVSLAHLAYLHSGCKSSFVALIPVGCLLCDHQQKLRQHLFKKKTCIVHNPLHSATASCNILFPQIFTSETLEVCSQDLVLSLT